MGTVVLSDLLLVDALLRTVISPIYLPPGICIGKIFYILYHTYILIPVP